LININSNKRVPLIANISRDFYKFSYYDFYQNIYKKHQFIRISFIFLIKNFFLVLLSLYTIIKIFLFKKKLKANYFIIRKNKDNFIDPRSRQYIKISNLKLRLNFVRSENFFESLKVFFLYPNIVFINSFRYFIIFFLRIKSLDCFCEKIHKQNFLNYIVLKKIFMILKIKEIHLIDDYRIMPLILTICDELNVTSIGYMHGNISKNNLIHENFAFSKIYLWSNYYKIKLTEINSQYKSNKKIIINKNIKYSSALLNNFKKKKDYTEVNLLYVLDEVTNVKLQIKSFAKIIKNKNINLFIKFRPNSNPNKILMDYCFNNNIKFYYKKDIYKICLENKINFIISSYSTMLIEASLMGIYPLMLVNKKIDLSNEFILDKAVIPIVNLYYLNKTILKLINNKSILKNIQRRVWQ
jgi:hypothetical protein